MVSFVGLIWRTDREKGLAEVEGGDERERKREWEGGGGKDRD